jgi:L-lactate dehydrogenase complex protein LldG
MVTLTRAGAPGDAAGRQDRLVEQLAERAARLGVKTHRVATLDEVAALVADLATDGGPAAFPPAQGAPWRVAIAPSLDAAHPALRQHLAAREVAVGAVAVDDPGGSFAGVAVGVSAAVHGVAETGTLVVVDPLADRLVRMLSPKHVVILAIEDLLPSLDEAAGRMVALVTSGAGPYITFITGPSRTADIEMSLTVGAHGPAELHIAVLGAAAK